MTRPDAPGAERPTESKRFCARCGEPAIEPPAGTDPPAFALRVCGACGMGVLLSCGTGALPGAKTAFFVVTARLDVVAVSRAAEPIFGPEETLVGQRGLLDLLTSTVGDAKLGRTARQAALRVHDPVTLPVRLAGDRADEVGTMACRISTCGSPRAALISVEPTHFGRA